MIYHEVIDMCMMSWKPGNEFAVLLFQNVKQVIDFSTYLLGYKINSFVYNLAIFDIWVILTEEVITFKSGHKKIIGKYFFHPIILF